MSKFWDSGMVTQNNGGELATVTMPQHTAVDRYDITQEMTNILPARLADSGWVMINDSPSFWLASHPTYGATGAVYYAGHGIHLVRQRLVDMITALSPVGSELVNTAVSHQLTTINENVAELETAARRLEVEIAKYNRNRCNGRPYYRTADSGTVFLYAHHTAGAYCPTCGEHPQGKRLRKYIGEEGTATADNAMSAMRYQEQWEQARAELDTVQQKLQRVNRLIWQLEQTLNGRMVSS